MGERLSRKPRQTFAVMPTLAIVGLGPSDSSLLTLGALERLQKAPRTAVCTAPPALTEYLNANGVAIVSPPLDGAALLRGVPDAVQSVVDFAAQGDAALGVPGHPMIDFPGLPHLVRALDDRKVQVELGPGVPRSALSAATSAPLLPLPPVARRQAIAAFRSGAMRRWTRSPARSGTWPARRVAP